MLGSLGEGYHGLQGFALRVEGFGVAQSELI